MTQFHFLQDYRSHLDACAVQLVIYGMDFIPYLSLLDNAVILLKKIIPSYTECIVLALGLVRFVAGDI